MIRLQGKKEFTLVVREEYISGNNGWVVEELAKMDDQPSVALDGYLIAHDIVEHVNGIEAIGGIGEELQAMGGLWNTRGQWGDIHRGRYTNRNSPQEAVAYDFQSMAMRYINGEEMGYEIPEEVQESEYEEDFNDIWENTIVGLRKEIKYLSLSKKDIEKKIKEFHKAAERFFHMGVIKHQALYGDQCEANTIFFNIVEALEGKIEKEPESYQRISLNINYDDSTAIAMWEEFDFDFDDEYEEVTIYQN
jgi:hypothetical protein